MRFSFDVTVGKLLESWNSDAHRALFAQDSGLSTLVFDEPARRLVASDLEITLDGRLIDIEMYTQGKYRPKTHGPGGHLGDFGEAFAYLYNRAQKRVLVRVVQSERTARNQRGDRLPMPDFLLSSPGQPLGVLEVKSGEALNFQAMQDAQDPSRYMWLAHCKRVEELRRRALPQLGFDPKGARLQRYRHLLHVRSRSPVPFPAGYAEANIILAIDGRVRPLRGRRKLKTPKHCTRLGRTCWECLETSRGPLNLSLFQLRNAPGLLPLLEDWGHGDRWLRAYQLWGQSLWARAAGEIDERARNLLRATRQWLREAMGSIAERIPDMNEAERFAFNGHFEVLESQWPAYVINSMEMRGLLDSANQLRGENEESLALLPEFDEPDGDPILTREPVVTATGRADARPLPEPGQRLSVAATGDSPWAFTVTRDESGYMDVRCCSSVWRDNASGPSTSQRPISDEQAATAARECVVSLLGVEGAADAVPRAIPLAPVSASVGDLPVPLGWRHRPQDANGNWSFPDRYLPKWLRWLQFGDPRAELMVHPDGRAHLRVSRE